MNKGLTEKEIEILDRADNEYGESRKISEKCPRCGGRIVFEGEENSHEIKCENNCIKMTFRGL